MYKPLIVISLEVKENSSSNYKLNIIFIFIEKILSYVSSMHQSPLNTSKLNILLDLLTLQFFLHELCCFERLNVLLSHTWSQSQEKAQHRLAALKTITFISILNLNIMCMDSVSLQQKTLYLWDFVFGLQLTIMIAKLRSSSSSLEVV